MGRLLFSLFFLVFFSFCSCVCGLEELRVLAPDTLKGDFLTGGLIKEVPALFGVPTYREARTGQLVIASPADGCSTIDKTNWPAPDKDHPDSPVSVILLIKRGTCSFVTKVRNAETAGARFVIVYNDKAASFLPFMADDGTGKNIGIPSVLITNEDATKLINYITAHAGTKVLMSLLYRLPNPDNRVEWDLFTSSWDPQTLEFKEEMIPVVKALDTQQFFTPHYYILDGKAIGCSNAQGNQCGTQCTHGGQYCAVDPERNMNTGIDGKDVILQDLREYCVNQWIKSKYTTEGKNQYLYFEFVSQFARRCYNVTIPSLWQNDACAYQILDELKIDKQNITDCITASGGADGTDPNKENTILKQFIKEREDYGVFSLPYSFVNAYPYRGGYTCTDPIRNDGRCGVVEAICQGFADTPAACNTDGSCAFGVAMDQCGVCGGDSTSCLGCDGVVKSGKIYDACGVCGGDGKCQQLSTGQIVGIVFASLLSVGLLSIGVYLYMKRQNKKMREDIDSLLKQYLPLEGGTNQGAGNHQPGGRLVDVNDSDM